MQPAILINYWHFKARLTEWADEDVIKKYLSEVFGMYSMGKTVPQVAAYLAEMEAK